MGPFRSASEALAAGTPDLGGIQRASQRGSRQHEAYMAAIQARQQQAMSPVGGGGDLGPAPAGGDLQGYARQRLAQMGLQDPGEFDALYRLWQKESGWNPNAVNRSSGAWGIAQTLPSAHPNVRRNNDGRAQIDWGLNYILGRYGRPSQAWAHSQRKNWY